MNIDFYSYSGIGGRPVNEDSFACGEGYYIVSDGLGGHDNGEVASAAAVGYISENYRSDISPEAAGALLAGADDAVKRLGDGGKATVAALFTNGDKIRIANVGDSRVYYFRRGNIYFRTKDHSVCQASVDMGEMTDDDVRHSADRSGLLKVLGDSAPLKLPKPYDLIDPVDGDAFLICSDGFWEHIYDLEMQADLLKSANSQEWMRHMLKRVLLRSENKGDNFTAVCGIIHAPDRLPRTASTFDNVTVDIPAASGNTGGSAMSGGRKRLIVGAAAAVACVALGAIAAVLIMNAVKPADEQSTSSKSKPPKTSSADGSNASNDPNDPDNPGWLGGDPNESGDPDTSGDPNTSDNSDSSEDPNESGDLNSSDSSDTSEDPNESGDPNSTDSSDTSDSSDSTGSSEAPSDPILPPLQSIPDSRISLMPLNGIFK